MVLQRGPRGHPRSAVGQLAACRQFLASRRSVRETLAALTLLERADDHANTEAFRRVLGALPPGHVRDLVLHWLELGATAPETRALHLFENARERREIQEGKLVGFHVSLNRNIMKLGFLGTLVGLLLTFPPMRAAVMGLADSGGEMRFIADDMAKAIDEDAYAIQATLVSMGFSLFLEAIVPCRRSKRLLVGFQLVNWPTGTCCGCVLGWRAAPRTRGRIPSVRLPGCVPTPPLPRKAYVAEEKARLPNSRCARRAASWSGATKTSPSSNPATTPGCRLPALGGPGR